MPTDKSNNQCDNFGSPEFVNRLLRKLAKLSYIKPGDVPDIELYMDQVTTFMDSHLSDIKRYEDDKTLTKTMINNYTKNKLLPPPVKKKYFLAMMPTFLLIKFTKSFITLTKDRLQT